MFRSRVVLAIIGIIVIGVTSGAVAMLSGANTVSLASSTTATATASSAASASADSASTPTSPAPTATVPGAAPTHAASSGEIIDLHGTITGIDTGSMQFTLQDGSGTSWTVQVASNTTYEGASQTFDGLQAGMSAEVKGVIIGEATFHAYHVHAEN